MNRAERRRNEKLRNKKQASYNVTRPILNTMVREEIEETRKETMDEAVNTAMILLLTLPLEVLMNHYWTKSYQKRIPEFIEHVLEYYEAWQNGELDLDDLKQDLWEYGGIRLEEGNG